MYVTLVEFFSTVHFEMSLRRTWIRAGKFALIAFIWFFSTVFFKCLLKVIWWEQANLHCLHLFNFSPLWIIKCLLKDSLDSNPSSCSSGLTMSRSKSMIDPLSFDWKIPNNWIKYEWTALKKQKYKWASSWDQILKLSESDTDVGTDKKNCNWSNFLLLTYKNAD